MTEPYPPSQPDPQTQKTQYVRSQATPPPDEASRKKNRRRTWIFVGLVALVLILALAALVGLLNKQDLGSGGHDTPYASGSDNVAVIHVEGTIAEANETYNQEWLEKTINNARLDKNNKGIALVVDSGGGAIYESDATLLALKKYQEETGRPLYTYMEHLAASGGYYIATSSDAILINRNGLTGSIGVIGIMMPEVSGLMEKLGIHMEAVHTGANKLMSQPFYPLTEEQRAIFQAMSDEAYQQFVQVVADGRGMAYEQVQALADGRVYTPIQAKENGLIDEIVLSFDEFEAYFRDKEGFDDKVKFKDHTYQAPQTFFGSLMETSQGLADIQKDPSLQLLEALEEKAILQPAYLYQP